MSTQFMIAFGGPVLIGLIGCAIVFLTRPPKSVKTESTPSLEAVTARLAAAEQASRQAADDLAEIRHQLTIR